MADITQEDMRQILNAAELHQAPSLVKEPKSVLDDPGSAVFPGVDPRTEVTSAIDAGALNLDREIDKPNGDADQPESATAGNAPENPLPTDSDDLPINPKGIASSDLAADTLPSPKIEPGVNVKEGKAKVETLQTPIRLPNFTIGRASSYEWKIPEGVHFEFGQLKKENVVVDREEGVLRFTPLSAGEANVELPYNGGKRVVICMTINPDPWSLWPNPPPPVDESLVIFDSDKERLAQNHKSVIAQTYPGLKVIGASRRGRSHERSGTFRDDDMGVWSDDANGNYVFIVSDGAGSCKYSREGALQSVNFIKAKLDDNKEKLENAWQASLSDLKPDCNVGMLLALLASKAKEHLSSLALAVNADGHECKPKDFSGTLLMVAMKKPADGAISIVSFAIGDGAIAWYGGDGRFGLLNRPDSGEFGGGTRFLVTPEVWKSIFYPTKGTAWTWNSFCVSRVFCRKFSPQEAVGLRIFLMTDGVSDPWFETDAGLEDGNKWKEFSEKTLPGSGYNEAGLIWSDSPEVNAEKLWEWLYFKIVGNHDDRTLIMAYTTDTTMKEVCNG